MAEFKRLKAKHRDAERNRDPITIAVQTYSQGLVQVCRRGAALYHAAGNEAKAEAMLRRAIALQPRDTSSMQTLIAIYTAAERLPEALALCQRIQTLDPRNSGHRLRLGRLLSRLGRLDEAEMAFERAIAVAPNDDRVYRELAQFYLTGKMKLARTRHLAQRAVTLAHTADNHFVLAWACDVTGAPADAIRALERAMELNPNQTKYRQVCQSLKKREEVR